MGLISDLTLHHGYLLPELSGTRQLSVVTLCPKRSCQGTTGTRVEQRNQPKNRTKEKDKEGRKYGSVQSRECSRQQEEIHTYKIRWRYTKNPLFSFQIIKRCLSVYRCIKEVKTNYQFTRWNFENIALLRNYFRKWRISSENSRRGRNLHRKLVKNFQKIQNPVKAHLNQRAYEKINWGQTVMVLEIKI